MSSFARFILTPWEKIYSKLAQEHPVKGGSGIGAFSIHPHRGDTVALSDGSLILDKDPIIELHLINYKLRDVVEAGDSLSSNEFTLLRGEYRALASMAKQGEIDDFKAVYGMTLLGPIVRRLGFEVFPAQNNLGNRFIAAWQDILRRAYYPTGNVRKNKRPLVVYWMTKEALLEKFND